MKLIKKHLTNGQYLTNEYDKRSIFLHHTVGMSANSAWRWWNHTPERVGTPYIIDRDGTVIECFDPKYWAYHLGVKGDDNYHEKRSINIELVSAGPLRKIDGRYWFFPLWPNKSAAKEIPSKEVIEFKNKWRGHQYFHKYTDKQIKALNSLLEKLYYEFPTLERNKEPKKFYDYNEEVLTKHLGGIWSHTTVRADKNDVYPDKRLIKVVNQVRGYSTPRNTKKPSSV